jgi:hypothetical protein
MEGLLMHVLLMETTPGLQKEKNVTFHVAGAAPWQLNAMKVSKLQHCSLMSRLHLDSKKKKINVAFHVTG